MPSSLFTKATMHPSGGSSDVIVRNTGFHFSTTIVSGMRMPSTTLAKAATATACLTIEDGDAAGTGRFAPPPQPHPPPRAPHAEPDARFVAGCAAAAGAAAPDPSTTVNDTRYMPMEQ